MALTCIISEIKQHIHDFLYPLAFNAQLGGSQLEYCRNVWCGKNYRIVGLPGGKKLRICSAVSTVYQQVIDGQTSCECDSIVRAMHAMHTRRAIKSDYRTSSSS